MYFDSRWRASRVKGRAVLVDELLSRPNKREGGKALLTACLHGGVAPSDEMGQYGTCTWVQIVALLKQRCWGCMHCMAYRAIMTVEV